MYETLTTEDSQIFDEETSQLTESKHDTIIQISTESAQIFPNGILICISNSPKRDSIFTAISYNLNGECHAVLEVREHPLNDRVVANFPILIEEVREIFGVDPDAIVASQEVSRHLHDINSDVLTLPRPSRKSQSTNPFIREALDWRDEYYQELGRGSLKRTIERLDQPKAEYRYGRLNIFKCKPQSEPANLARDALFLLGTMQWEIRFHRSHTNPQDTMGIPTVFYFNHYWEHSIPEDTYGGALIGLTAANQITSRRISVIAADTEGGRLLQKDYPEDLIILNRDGNNSVGICQAVSHSRSVLVASVGYPEFYLASSAYKAERPPGFVYLGSQLENQEPIRYVPLAIHVQNGIFHCNVGEPIFSQELEEATFQEKTDILMLNLARHLPIYMQGCYSPLTTRMK